MNNNNDNVIGTAGIMDESMNKLTTTTNDDIDDAALPESPPSDAVNQYSLGGSIATPAYALLVGAALENESKILSIPLTSLPTTLGKQHDTKDVSFVGLTEYNSNDGDKTEGGSSTSNKSRPKLSKSMCCIYYRDGEQGGKLGCYKKRKKKPAAATAVKVGDTNNNDADEMSIDGDVDALNGMNYLPYENKAAEVAPNDIIQLPSMQQTDPLPRVASLQWNVPDEKSLWAIASHCFYFLLPKNVDAANNQKSIKVTLTKTVVKVLDGGSAAATTQSSKKKRDNDNDNSDDDATSDDSSILIKSPRPTKKSKSSSSTTDNNDLPFASTLESKTDTELLQMLSEATESNGWDKHSQNVGTTLATRACRAAANSSKLQKMNRDFTGVTQRDVMNWINKDSDTFGEYEKMMLRKIEPKSFGIAMGKAIIRAGYTKSDVKSGRANRWTLPGDIMATVAPPTMEKSPSTTQMKLLPTGGGGNKSPQQPMALPNASKVVEVIDKEEVDKSAVMDVSNNDNNGDGSGGAVDVTAKEESIKNAILPSNEDLKTF
eukprot:scaffold33527_cov137-Skeletonema_dohrnii-CCMP3373.AAC.1